MATRSTSGAQQHDNHDQHDQHDDDENSPQYATEHPAWTPRAAEGAQGQMSGYWGDWRDWRQPPTHPIDFSRMPTQPSLQGEMPEAWRFENDDPFLRQGAAAQRYTQPPKQPHQPQSQASQTPDLAEFDTLIMAQREIEAAYLPHWAREHRRDAARCRAKARAIHEDVDDMRATAARMEEQLEALERLPQHAEFDRKRIAAVQGSLVGIRGDIARYTAREMLLCSEASQHEAAARHLERQVADRRQQ